MQLRTIGLAIFVALSLSVAVQGQDPEPAPPADAPPPPRQPRTPPTPSEPVTTAPAETQPTPTPRTDLPAAKEIIDRSIEAMGGNAAFEAITSSAIKATMSTPMGNLDLEMNWKRPNMVFIKQSMPEGAGGGLPIDSTMGSDGSVAWVKNQMGYQILDPAQAKQMQEQANMFSMVLRLRDQSKELMTVDQTTFNGRDCYKISAIDEEGSKHFVYFDVEERLFRGIESTQMGPVTIKFSDWKEDAGIKYFTKMEVDQMGQNLALIFNEVKFNTLDASTFALPEEVKAMLKERDQPQTQPETQPATAPAGG